MRHPRRGFRLATPAVVAAVMVLTIASAVVSAMAVDRSATVEQVATRRAPPDTALLVSDSAWLGIKTYGAIDAVQGFAHVLDLASCRRRVTASCRNYDGHVPITLFDEVAARSGTMQTLIVATGYNDSDRNFASDVDDIVSLARSFGYRRVLWVTLRENVTYTSPGNAGFAAVFANNNTTLRDLVASGRYPELIIADWATYARDRPEWFAGDGIHLDDDGPWAAADYVSRKMAFLDGRACPQPFVAGAAAPAPCPDPDLRPPEVDLASVYPIGRRNPTAGFFMEWEGHGAWPNPPWWTS